MTLSQQVGVKGIVFSSPVGMNLDEKVLEHMRDDQIQQLYDLMQAATGKAETDSCSETNASK